MMMVVSAFFIAFLIVLGMLQIVRFPMQVVFRMIGLMTPVRMFDDIGKTSAGDREERETNQQQAAASGATPENTIRPALRRGQTGMIVRMTHGLASLKFYRRTKMN